MPVAQPARTRKPSPFRYFKTSPEIIRLALMPYIRFPLSLRNAEDLLHQRGIDISHQIARLWRNRLGRGLLDQRWPIVVSTTIS